MRDNIAYAAFGNCNKAVTNALWQYDYGQVLQISGVELPESFEVHFCNRGNNSTITQIGQNSQVSIPDEFLTKPTWVDAYIFLHSGADDGETVYSISIPVSERPKPTDEEPTPEEQSAITQAIAALNAATAAIPDEIDTALAEAKASGEFDGQDGNSIWTTTETPMPATGGVAFTQLTGRTGVAPAVGDIVVRASRYVYQLVEISESGTVFVARLLGDIKGERGVADAIWRTTAYIVSVLSPTGSYFGVYVSDLIGRSGATPKAGDLVIGPEPSSEGDPTHLYSIQSVSGTSVKLDDVGSIAGAGVPTGGTAGQVLAKASGADYDTEWVNQSGGGGTSDYDDLTNKPSINGVELSGSKTATQLGLANASDIPTVPVQSVNGKTGAVVLDASDVGAGTYSKPSGGIPKTDLASAVQTSLGKADTALQSVPSTYRTSAAQDVIDNAKLEIDQGVANAGKFLVVGSDGNITAVTMTAWQGGSY